MSHGSPEGTVRLLFIGTAATPCNQWLIESCEHCNPEGAEILFDAILDGVTGSDPSVTITI